ncbi:hypothetical protein FRC09_003326 [Ceratobasidium sp. 395]|nr:hypothetical protein FRC09_003326 [Ceratobasidium sp. 395]
MSNTDQTSDKALGPRRGDRSRTRSWRAQENFDNDQELLQQQRETTRRNSNIRSQQAAQQAEQAEQDEEGEDADEEEEEAEEPPPVSKGKKVEGKGKKRASLSPAPAVKSSTKSTETNGDVAQRNLIGRIAARDGRTDHFDFTLKQLRAIWASGGKSGAASGSSGDKEIFASKQPAYRIIIQLRDLGSVEAPERSQASLGKGKPAKTILVSSRNSSRASNVSSNRKSSGAHKATSRISSAASTGSRTSSPGASVPRVPSKPTKHDDKRAACSDAKTKDRDLQAKEKDAKSKEKQPRGRSPSSKLPPLAEQEEDDASTDPNLSDRSFASEESDDSRIGDTDGAPPRKGKPKSGDYEGSDAELIEATVDKVCQRLIVGGWFVGATKYSPLIVRTWRYAVRKLGFQPSHKRISLRKIRVVKFRVTSLQGRIKQAIKNQVVSHFKLDRGTTEEIAQRAEKWKGAKPETGFYQSEFLEDAIKHSLFAKKKSGASIATMYPDKFRRMPLPTIAFICALSHFLLKSFIPGELPIREKKKRKSKKRAADSDNDSGEESVDDSIDREKVLGYYNTHLSNLQNLRKGDADVAEALRVKLWKAGSTYAKFKSPVKRRNGSESSDDGVITLATIVRGRQATKNMAKTSTPTPSCSPTRSAGKKPAPVPAKRNIEAESDNDTEGSLDDNNLFGPTGKAARLKSPTQLRLVASPVHATPSLAQPKLVIDSVSIPRSVGPKKVKLPRVDSTPTKIPAQKPRDSQKGEQSDEDAADDESEDGEKGNKGSKRGGSESRVEDGDGEHGTRSEHSCTSKQRTATGNKPRSSPHKRLSVTKNVLSRKKRQVNSGDEEEAVPVESTSTGTSTKRRKYMD